MKGLVFTELLDMVDYTFGPAITEEMVVRSELPSGGAYTAVGSYAHAEIVSLVSSLSALTGRPACDLVITFGEHLLDRFADMHPEHFRDAADVMTFIERVDGRIHKEVQKLYPDASLPQISTSRKSGDELVVDYRSQRMMGDLAEGLIKRAIARFGNGCSYTREDLEPEGGSQCVRFTLKKYLQ